MPSALWILLPDLSAIMQRNEVCMNTKTVFNRLQSIDDEVQKLHNTIFALKTTDIQAYADKYEELSKR